MKKRNRMIANNKLLKIIPWAIAFVLIIIITILIIWYFFTNKTIRFDEPVYHYFLGTKMEYADGIELSYKEGTVYYEMDDYSYAADGSPLILQNGKTLYLTTSMGYTNPAKSAASYRVNYFSYIQKEEQHLVAEHNGIKSVLDKGFLYDGDGTFIFLDSVTIVVGNMQFELPPMSYVKNYYRDSLEIYNAVTEEYEFVMLVDMDAYAVSELGYKLNLGTNVISYKDEERILFSNIEAMGVLK